MRLARCIGLSWRLGRIRMTASDITVGADLLRAHMQLIRADLIILRSLMARLRWPILGGALLLLAVTTHWPVRHGFFQADDFTWLHLAHWRSVLDAFVGNQGSNLAYRPIFRLSTYLDAVLFGRDATAWHFENVVLHAANALLLAALANPGRDPAAIGGDDPLAGPPRLLPGR